jgi:hypothetical protein
MVDTIISFYSILCTIGYFASVLFFGMCIGTCFFREICFNQRKPEDLNVVEIIYYVEADVELNNEDFQLDIPNVFAPTTV